MNARGALGRYGEEVAVRALLAAGLTVVGRNWRHGRRGEIDILATEGDALVVCEVKTRRAGPFQHPMAALPRRNWTGCGRWPSDGPPSTAGRHRAGCGST